MGHPSKFAGLINAAEFAYGINKTTPALQVINGPNATGSAALTLAFGYTQTSDGIVFNPLNTNAPITVGGNSSTETVTPSAVSNSTPTIYSSPSVTATYTYLHGNGDSIRSGTVGLQEALNYAASIGGGVVIVDAGWYALGGTIAILDAATVPAGVSIWDNHAGSAPTQSVTVPLTLAQIQNAFTTSVPIIPAPGAGNMIDVIDATLNLIFGTNAFTTGGAAQLSYGTGTTYPASATIAAAVYTGLAANTIVKVAGAATSSTSSNYLNKPIDYANATAAFAAGTGCSGVLQVNYKVLTGLA